MITLSTEFELRRKYPASSSRLNEAIAEGRIQFSGQYRNGEKLYDAGLVATATSIWETEEAARRDRKYMTRALDDQGRLRTAAMPER